MTRQVSRGSAGEYQADEQASKFLVEFSCEAVWSWAFVCWKISDYSFNFCACDESVKIFYFFLVQFSIIKKMNTQVSRGSAGDYQADEQAGVARLSWRVSGR